MAGRLSALTETIAKDREGLVAGQFGSVSVDMVKDALTRLLAMLHMKFQWVHSLPYLVWQAWISLTLLILSSF